MFTLGYLREFVLQILEGKVVLVRDMKAYERSGSIKAKATPLQAWTGPEGSRRFEAPRFQDNRHMKVVRLSALRTGRFLPPRKYSRYSFLLEAKSTPGP